MLIDISPPLSEKSPVWPGDVAFSRRHQCRIDKGDNIDLSSVQTTVHIGAHADAPSHYDSAGKTIDQVSIEPYIGPCQVVTVRTPVIKKNDLDFLGGALPKRLLIRTCSFDHQSKFDSSFSVFCPDAIRFCSSKGVKLIGIDTPSFDDFHSKSLPSHMALLETGIRNLEGLELCHVADGLYELVALPLKLVGFDASPVRAILRSLD